MNRLIGGIFNFADRLQMSTLDQRHKRGEVISSNIANAETPGFRAIGYDFEEQLQALARLDRRTPLKVGDDRHFRNTFTKASGEIEPDVYVQPSESVGDDGNTVDLDAEMSRMSTNNILYRSAVELLNRKVGMIRYAINGGR